MISFPPILCKKEPAFAGRPVFVQTLKVTVLTMTAAAATSVEAAATHSATMETATAHSAHGTMKASTAH